MKGADQESPYGCALVLIHGGQRNTHTGIALSPTAMSAEMYLQFPELTAYSTPSYAFYL